MLAEIRDSAPGWCLTHHVISRLLRLDVERPLPKAALHDGVMHVVCLPHGVGELKRVALGARLRRHITLRHVTSRHATPRHATPRHATPRHLLRGLFYSAA